MKKIYAFWNYDTYPYILGGEVEEVKLNADMSELVYCNAYHSLFQPIFILEDTKGKFVKDGLEMLTLAKREADKKMNDEYMKKRKMLLEMVGVDL
jgi:hypothetical protein